jgi:hypothetical protein
MATARPLRDVFADVTGDEAARASDPAELLRSHGHEDLPDTLVAEAVTSYADTAPLEVAEHLSQYVMANSAVPGVEAEVDPSSWLVALSGAPETLAATVDPAAAGLDEQPPAEPAGAESTAVPTLDAFDLDFGLGGEGARPDDDDLPTENTEAMADFGGTPLAADVAGELDALPAPAPLSAEAAPFDETGDDDAADDPTDA